MEFLFARIDFVGLSSETKPTKELKNGSTYYEVDTQTLFIWYKGIWYNQNPEVSESRNVENLRKSEELIPEIEEKVEVKKDGNLDSIN